MPNRFYTVDEIEKRTSKVKLTPEIYRNAFSEGMNLSSFLEKMDPSDENDTLDAFERQIAKIGIKTRSNRERGIYSDKIERFYASNVPQSSVLFPEFINREMRIAKSVVSPLNGLIAVSTPINSDVYRTIYLDETDLSKYRMKRVTEGSEVPTATLATSENAINLKKYGLRLKASYEAIRRMSIDQLRIHLQAVALQTNLDKATAAIDVLINGDGNNNAATSMTALSLDSTATAGITYKAWIAFLMKLYPYQCKTIVGNEAALLEILTMQFPSVDPLMLLAKYADSSTGMNVQMQNGVFTTVNLSLLPSAPDNTLVGLDSGFALEEVTEIGANLTETDKIISSQFNEIVLTEVSAFGKLYAGASKALTFA